MARKAAIPKQQQDLIVARHLSGESPSSIAADLKLPLTTVYWYSRVAKNKIVQSKRDFTEPVGDAFEGNLIAQQTFLAMFSDREWLEKVELDRLRELRTTYGVLVDKSLWFLTAATSGGSAFQDAEPGSLPVGPSGSQSRPAGIAGLLEAPVDEEFDGGAPGVREELANVVEGDSG